MKSKRIALVIALGVWLPLAAASLLAFDTPLPARAALLGSACLVLWLSELIPPYATTLLLLTLTPVLLGPLDAAFRAPAVLRWVADPVIALFFGGFTLSAAASRYGIDARVAGLVVRSSRGRRRLLIALVSTGTATLSMWMSNIAAPAMMLAALRPLLRTTPLEDPFRRALLLSIALGANFGGMATPIGSGPNALAIAAVGDRVSITFVDWMVLAIPLTVGMLALGVVMLIVGFRVKGKLEQAEPPALSPHPGAKWVAVIFFAAVAGWLTEPLHGIPSSVVALAAATLLFGSRLLTREDLSRIDWPTLLLIAGGISLGHLLERSGLISLVAGGIDWSAFSPTARLFSLVLVCALLSAVMSNTATATFFIPLAMGIDPSPSTAVIMAIGASFGMPFTISTPANAMIYGEGGLRLIDLLWPGLVLMLFGCVLISLTGPQVLALVGL